ncbi:NAD-dependent epimerase/dehydratase family protein [Tardiphaga sp. 862_B3_N1_1]|uniref:NAD-dependent epimerase/dehydratase family protein n=1 Tax=Tardiphaga sp. 862_B3_N1_1 TaxID=3240763 RepID=UPI003F8A62A8
MVNPPERILVVGAAGFLGAAVCRYFSELGLFTIGVDIISPVVTEHYGQFHHCSDLDSELGAILDRHEPTYLINLAGNANVGKSIEEPRYDFLLSVNLYSLILDQVRLRSPDTRVLLASSAAIYGQPRLLPIKEDMPPQPLSPYGYHKVMCEQLAVQYHKIYGLNVASLRIFSAYGSGLRKQIFWDLCVKCAADGPIRLGGDGTESRDFIHALDIAQATLCILRGGAFTGESYNVARGIETTVSDIAHRVVAAFGDRTDRIVFTGASRAGDPKNWRADIGLINALGFAPRIEIEDGVAEYVRWFRNL